MDKDSAMLLLATQKTDPHFTEKISKHIDRYGTIDADDGKIVNGRYYRLFLVNQMVVQTHPVWKSAKTDCRFISSIAEDMIKTEVSSQLSYFKNRDMYDKFYTDAQAIGYAVESAMHSNSPSDRKHARRIRTLLKYLDDEDSIPADLFYISHDGIVRSL